MSIIISLALKFWPYIVAAVGFGFGALKWRSSIIKAERAKQAAAEAKARDVADDVQNDIGALTPEQRRERLRQWAKS